MSKKYDVAKELDNYLETFSLSIQRSIQSSNCDRDAQFLFDELARQTYYLFTYFRDAIVDNIKE